MSKNFNLLLLHSPTDIHPRTWICLGGKKLKITFKELEKDVLKNQEWHREKLGREIAKRLNCATIKQTLQGKREFYPIPIILELLKFTKNKKRFLKEFKENIEYLKVNSASAKPIKAVYRLNENLAKILGAFMADGSLSIQVVIAALHLKDLKKARNKLTNLGIRYSIGSAPSRNQHYISIQTNKDNFKLLSKVMPSFHFLTQTHYGFELTDGYKDNVEAFIGWIKGEFNISPSSFKKRGNAWRVSFSNKILARYLMFFFEVSPGPKAYSAFEPKLIKKSNLRIRKAFAKGILMFDGCVTKHNKIQFGTVSSSLYDSIKQIWEEDNIKFGKSIGQRVNRYIPKSQTFTFFSLFSTAENKKGKLLQYFEPGTQKWKLINWLSGDLNCAPILKTSSSLSTRKMMKILQKIKRCDAVYLQNYFKCSHSTIRSYLKILKNQRKIKLSNTPSCINNYVSRKTTVLLKNRFHKLLFKKVRKKFKKDKNFAKFLGVHKATISAWKLKKNRMPVYVLKEMCVILDLSFNKASKNILKTDREIAEII